MRKVEKLLKDPRFANPTNTKFTAIAALFQSDAVRNDGPPRRLDQSARCNTVCMLKGLEAAMDKHLFYFLPDKKKNAAEDWVIHVPAATGNATFELTAVNTGWGAQLEQRPIATVRDSSSNSTSLVMDCNSTDTDGAGSTSTSAATLKLAALTRGASLAQRMTAACTARPAMNILVAALHGEELSFDRSKVSLRAVVMQTLFAAQKMGEIESAVAALEEWATKYGTPRPNAELSEHCSRNAVGLDSTQLVHNWMLDVASQEGLPVG
jgi:hypothetical protein